MDSAVTRSPYTQLGNPTSALDPSLISPDLRHCGCVVGLTKQTSNRSLCLQHTLGVEKDCWKNPCNESLVLLVAATWSVDRILS